ncbi:hypothetical protein SLEP1_g42438 [Rubroshorea leprosula]|uniref:Uncharacterized protein n=1 Tax=Rubroshorea leprosula TaxID=152421 RepID=A0AAV5L9W8_9ROSI|nr:hypothetical protein SLEP1_g42438 [Rubroshorea leprosula]
MEDDEVEIPTIVYSKALLDQEGFLQWFVFRSSNMVSYILVRGNSLVTIEMILAKNHH